MKEQNKQHIESSPGRRWPWYILLTITVLLAGIRLSFNTDFIRSIVKDRIVSSANNQLSVDFSVEKLNGDLWHEVILHGISITDTGADTLAGIDSLRISYNLLSYFGSAFEISEIAISKPFLKLRQRDSTLNIATWVKESPSDTVASKSFPIRVEKFSLSRGKVDALIAGLAKDSVFVADNIRMNGSFALSEEGYEADIAGFSFDISQTRLDEKISFETKLHAEKKTISLEKLVVATGTSVLKSSGRINTQDSTSRIDIQARPLSWKDIATYVDESPVRQNLQLGLQINGSLNQLQAGLNVDATDIEGLEIGTNLAWDSTLSITKVQLSAERLNLGGFLGDTSLPDLQNIRMEANGEVSVQDYKNGSMKGTFSTSRINYSSYSLDMLKATFSLFEQAVSADVSAAQQQQELQAALKVDRVWGNRPEVGLTVNGTHVNPGYWLKDDQYEGDFSFSGEINGTGFLPRASPWNYRFNFDRGKFYKQEFNRLSLRGTVSDSKITNKTLFRLRESEVTFNAQVHNYRDVPEFTYNLYTESFNLSECRNMEEFTSSISLSIEGKGRGATLEMLQLESAIRMDSSAINGEYVDSLAAYISIKDSIATVKPAGLKSTIADGSFDARLHLGQWYDTENELNLDLEIKDIAVLAPLAGIDDMSAEGTITGNLSPVYEENLKFSGDVKLDNLVYNDFFNAEKATGKVEVLVVEQPEFMMDINLVSPVFSAISLQDLTLQTRGKIYENNLDGNFLLNFKGPNESEIIHKGLYNFSKDSSVVTTENYELTSSLRTLSLQRPFSVVIEDQVVRMDTMKLSSDDGATLELAIPYADSVRQQGYLIGKNLNLAAIQNTLLSEAYFEGILSGNLTVSNSDTAFEASGNLLFSDLIYKGTSIDSLKIELDVGNNQLKGNLGAADMGDQLIKGEINLPFRLGNPEQFDEAFFDKPVEGFLEIKPVTLSRFDTLLTRMGIEDTDGIFNLRANLTGTAGEPQFTGNLALDNAMISGVKVDSLTAGLQYVHESSTLSLSAAVNSLKQRAAEINVRIPFYMDLKKGEVSLPGKQDSISVDIQTNNFNLAAFNDFVDKQRVRNIKGRVNGMVHVRGTLDELETKGQLNLSQGSVRVVPTGITVDGIRSALVFKPDLLTIQNFKANSGSGSMNMNGSIALEELVPGEVDISVKASNFKIANNSQYNAVIDVNTQVTGSFIRPNVSGSLSILNGFVQLDNFGEKSVENVQLDSSVQPDQNVALYDSLTLDVDVSFNRRFFIRNQQYLEMQVELDGSVDMLKDAGKELQMFGTLKTVSGYARPLGKRFELEEGVVTFTGSPGNPDLNIRSLFEPQQPEEEIRIWYIIEGSVEDPQFKYESSPPMELDDILCYTLFGQPCFALESWKRAVASSGSNSSATDLALEVFMDRIESLATQRLGIDVVKIDNTRIGGEIGTSITTGWYINPRVFFAIQNVISGSTPDTGFLLEYLLQENLRLIISQGNDSRQGVDLKWNYDY